MIQMTYYAIRHKASGDLMPQCTKRGYSHWNPATNSVPETSLDVPRLFHAIKNAKSSIGLWSIGIQQASTDYFGDTEIRVKEDGRKKEDLEIVTIVLTVTDEVITVKEGK